MKQIRPIPLAEAIAEAERAINQPDINVSPTAFREIVSALLPASKAKLSLKLAEIAVLEKQLEPRK